MSEEKEYIGTYKVYKLYRQSCRRTIIKRGLTRDEAKALVNRYPDSKRHIVVFDKQFTAEKYFVEKKSCKHLNINREDGCDECLDCGVKNY